MPKEFIINDENVLNDRGFRVMTDGIRLDQFEKNPLGLFMHSRPDRWDLDKDTVLPICQWTNLRKENGKLYGTPVFDQKDEFAVKIEQKVEGGFLRMCSLGANPITTSSDQQYLLPTQAYETIVECNLIEVSIVDLASNPNAIALYKYENNQYIALNSEQSSTIVPLIVKPQNQKSETNMKKIAISLGLAEDATEDQMVNAIAKLKEREVSLNSQVETIRLSTITGAVEQAVAEKRITADKKEQMIALGQAVGIDSLKSTLELMRPVTKPTDHINGGSDGSPEITLASLIGKGIKAIESFKEANPVEYAELYKKHYGVEYVKPLEA